ncbi:MAG TPA: hypothetical protein VMQ86_10740 [Bryobacteraceae bacterium]|jgi:hypothetical protein|nr:hypothetical protein [Bryobacteraceae bacterium]
MTSFFRLTGRLMSGLCVLSLVALMTALVPVWAQSADGAGASTAKPAASDGAPPVLPAKNPADTANSPQPEQQDKRVFGVFPNYRTTDGNVPFQPITSSQKILIGLKDSFDWPVYPVAGAFAALYQIENQNPSFGQGMKGYARRYGTALADQVIGNMMTESFVPSLLHQDPRYFRIGKSRGGVMYRAAYAASRIFVSRTDSGGQQFNVSEWLGNGIAVAISNAYYPDTRTVGSNMERLGIACATDAFSQVMKEFWPDVKHALFHRHEPDTQPLLSESHPVAH